MAPRQKAVSCRVAVVGLGGLEQRQLGDRGVHEEVDDGVAVVRRGELLLGPDPVDASRFRPLKRVTTPFSTSASSDAFDARFGVSRSSIAGVEGRLRRRTSVEQVLVRWNISSSDVTRLLRRCQERQGDERGRGDGRNLVDPHADLERQLLELEIALVGLARCRRDPLWPQGLGE